MIASKDYYLTYYPNQNRIVISLPQTWRTLTNTTSPVIDRRIDVKESELMCLLQVVQVLFCKDYCPNCGAKMDEVTEDE